MIISVIHIENYRCFKTYDISFATKTTVLIGKNGTGKTSLISALKSAMKFIFSKYKIAGMELLSTTPDLYLGGFAKTDSYYDKDKRSYQYPISIKCSAIGNNFGDGSNGEMNTVQWALVKQTPNGKLLDTHYREAFTAFIRHYNSDILNSEMPVLAYFSDSYPHKRLGIPSYAKSELKKGGQLSRSFGYYMWDAEANCAEIWQARYISIYSQVNDYKSTPEDTVNQRNEIDFIDQRIKTFTQPLRAESPFINSEFEVKKISLLRPDKKDVYIQFAFTDGREILFENLPQGYNRLLSIVLDIAYRSYILNPGKEPSGIVFIDEIELHLHPSLQQEVLLRFRKTFPKVQFILSTHSPLVISNLNADGQENKIIKLENDNLEYTNSNIKNIYGIDYGTSLVEVMDSGYRSTTIDKLINAYLVLYGKKRELEADLVLQKLADYLQGSIPDLLMEEIENQKKAYH